jgi:DNA-binding transcriptional ArsR family regulator
MTPDEARAIANPLRLRILRTCRDEALTNKQIADRLNRDPGTTLHHVRKLVATGFLAAEEVRTGAGGALEKPYRSTGKSWALAVAVLDPDLQTDVTGAPLEALCQEMAAGPPGSAKGGFRFGVRLKEADREELLRRLAALGEEIKAKDDPDGERIALYCGLRYPVSEPAGSAGPCQ